MSHPGLVEGRAVVDKIVKGDKINSLRIVRVGEKAKAFKGIVTLCANVRAGLKRRPFPAWKATGNGERRLSFVQGFEQIVLVFSD